MRFKNLPLRFCLTQNAEDQLGESVYERKRKHLTVSLTVSGFIRYYYSNKQLAKFLQFLLLFFN